MAIIAKYSACKWEAADGYTDYMLGSPAQAGPYTFFSRREGAQNQPVPGASVIAIHEPSGTSYEATTRADGRYSIPSMRVGGPYEVTASLSGFQTQVRGYTECVPPLLVRNEAVFGSGLLSPWYFDWPPHLRRVLEDYDPDVVVFLFVVMLVGVDASDSLVETIKGQRALAWVTGLAFAVIMVVGLTQLDPLFDQAGQIVPPQIGFIGVGEAGAKGQRAIAATHGSTGCVATCARPPLRTKPL